MVTLTSSSTGPRYCSRTLRCTWVRLASTPQRPQNGTTGGGDSSWSSTTTVPGIRTNAWRRLGQEWFYRLGPIEASFPLEIPFYSVRGLRQYNRHYKALADAEHWARAFQEIQKRWKEEPHGIWK